MKKIYFTIFAFIFTVIANAQCPTFTIGAPFGTVVGCNPSTVKLDAFNTSTLSGLTYTWISGTGTQFGSSIIASCPGASNTFTVVASAPSNTCLTTQTITISSNTTAPSMTVPITTQTLGCNGACKSFTAITSTTLNIFGTWSNSSGAVMVGPSTSPVITCVGAPGTYTATFTDTNNGCSSSQTVAVTSATNIPTFTVVPTGPNGFTITCTNSIVPMNISTTSSFAPLGYTWTPVTNPSASTTPAAGGYTASLPGQYVATMRDGYLCNSSTTITIFMDTIRPAPFARTNLPSNSFTLNCNTTSLVATALSAPILTGTNYAWISPPNIPISSNTIAVTLADISSSVTPTTYTVLAAGTNGCIRKSNVFFWKDTYVPPYSPAFTPSGITCTNSFVTMSPFSFTTTPINFTITSPSPTQTTSASGNTFAIPGTYTMNYVNPANGCTAITTTVLPLNITPPATFAVGPYSIPCGTSSTNITAGTTASTSNSYSWTSPAGATMDNPTGSITSADMPGTYTVFINNFVNGCGTYNYVQLNQATSLVVPINGKDTICIGYGTSLSTNVSGATSYSWNTGSTSNVIFVTPTITTVYNVAVTNTNTGCSGSNTFTVLVSPCVGIDELTLNSHISISPNPNNGKFNVDINTFPENTEIKIINAIGQEVFKQQIKQGRTEVNAIGLAKGIYYYVIIQNKEPINRGKIIID